MESNLNQDGIPRPSYVFSADPVARPSEINFDSIKLDLSREFSLVASSTEVSTRKVLCWLSWLSGNSCGTHTRRQVQLEQNFPTFVGLRQPSKGDQRFTISRWAFWDIDIKLVIKKQKVINVFLCFQMVEEKSKEPLAFPCSSIIQIERLASGTES